MLKQRNATGIGKQFLLKFQRKKDFGLHHKLLAKKGIVTENRA